MNRYGWHYPRDHFNTAPHRIVIIGNSYIPAGRRKLLSPATPREGGGGQAGNRERHYCVKSSTRTVEVL
jgi:hypothetical protein